jgi:hypothetical protein
MGVRHQSFLFSPARVQAALIENVVREGRVSKSLFYSYVHSVLDNATQTTKELLRTLCFTYDWLDMRDQDVSHFDEWYLIAVAKEARPAIELKPVWFAMLEALSLERGWGPTTGTRLLRGKSLKRLLARFPLTAEPIFSFSSMRNVGWIAVEEARTLRNALRRNSKFLLKPSTEVMAKIDGIARKFKETDDVSNNIRCGYDSVVERLARCIEGKQHLLLLNDRISYLS